MLTTNERVKNAGFLIENMIKEQLYELGFSRSEAKVYLALLEQGPSSAGKISKKAGLNRTSTYQVLERMMAQGLISYVRKGRVHIYQVLEPGQLISLHEEKLRLAEVLVPELEKLGTREAEEATIYTGRKGIRSILQEILHCKSYVSFGSGGQFLAVMGHDFLLFQKEKKKRKIKSQVIIGKSFMMEPIVLKAYANFRFVDDKFMTPTTTWVYDNKVAVVVWSRIPIATLIKSKDAANAFRAYFALLWKSAERVRVC